MGNIFCRKIELCNATISAALYIELPPLDHCLSVITFIPVIPTHVHLSLNSPPKHIPLPRFPLPRFRRPFETSHP